MKNKYQKRFYTRYLALIGFFIITACGGGGETKVNPNPSIPDPSIPDPSTPDPSTPDPSTPDPGATIYTPPPLSTIHWQLQGNINTNYDVDIYDIDLFDTSKTLIEQLQSDGKKVICYFSGGSYENWRSDKDEFVEADLGKTLDGWAGERWLDIRSDNVKRIMKIRLDLAKEKGCDGVEPDNMDGYANVTDIALTANDQLVYNRFIAEESHARGLSVGLKNDLDQIGELVDYFDFAVNEQCFEYNECDTLTPFIEQNKAVFNVEYKSSYKNDSAKREALCADAASRKFTTLVLPLDLDDSFRLSCL